MRRLERTENRPCHSKMCLRAYANSDGPDEPAHPRSYISAFAVRKSNHRILQNVSVEGKYPDETSQLAFFINL